MTGEFLVHRQAKIRIKKLGTKTKLPSHQAKSISLKGLVLDHQNQDPDHNLALGPDQHLALITAPEVDQEIVLRIHEDVPGLAPALAIALEITLRRSLTSQGNEK